MLARRSLVRATAQPTLLGAAPSNARNMATLREIEMRLKSVKNIEKITKVSITPWCLWADLYIDTRWAVHENDCVHKACQGSESFEQRQRVRSRQ